MPKKGGFKGKKSAIIMTGAHFLLIIVLIPAVPALQEGVITVLVLTTSECPAGWEEKQLNQNTFLERKVGESLVSRKQTAKTRTFH